MIWFFLDFRSLCPHFPDSAISLGVRLRPLIRKLLHHVEAPQSALPRAQVLLPRAKAHCRARDCHCAPSRNLFCLRLFHSRLFVVVSLSGWLEEIQNKSSPIVRRDCLIVVDNENVSFSAVQHVPPWVASRRPLGTYLHPTIT